MSNQEITEWLKDSGLPLWLIKPNEWQLRMSHHYAEYTVTIVDHGDWLSYGADLIGDVSGPNCQEFYRRILQLNSKLNGTHIALENGRLVLIRDEFSEDINDYHLFRGLNLFHQSHEYVYRSILNEADMLDLHITDP